MNVTRSRCLVGESRSLKPTGDSTSNNDGLWLDDTAMSAIFVVLGALLLVFPFVGPGEEGLRLLLSLAGGSLIGYQVVCLVLFREALLDFARVDSCHFTVIIGRVALVGSVDMFLCGGCNQYLDSLKYWLY